MCVTMNSVVKVYDLKDLTKPIVSQELFFFNHLK